MFIYKNGAALRSTGFLLLSMAAAIQAIGADNETVILNPVTIVGTTPLPGVGLAQEQIPAAVQTISSATIAKSNALELTQFMNNHMGSVYLNEIQGNPLQPDVNYRGFTASPLLGTPQGLSVYMDGVRLNQPFGDVVSWDLIPLAAISSMSIMPGSNPLFGLNTLGGALSIQTKDGRNNPGAAVQLSYGSYNRRSAEIEFGGSKDNLDWFVTGNLLRDNGWRDNSPTRAGQLFTKLGWHDASTDLKLTYAYADTNLTGNGMQEQRLLANDYNSIYTQPDITKNKSHFLNLAGTHSVSDRLLLSGNAYYRKITTNTLNGDINEDSLNQSVYLRGENATNTPFPSLKCIDNVLLNDEPGEKCNGLNNRTSAKQQNYGLSGQFTLLGDLAGQRNQFTAGAGYDESRTKFSQSTQLGYLNPDRSVAGLNSYADGGITGGYVDGEPYDNRVDLNGRVRTWSLYATDTVSIRDVLHLTVSGRYNHSTVKNQDNINPGGGIDSLDGDHKFSRFNPAIGLSYTPSNSFRTYLGYNEGSRTPTSIELGCANPDNPCRLPNSMAGDPPLDQVVTKTIEAGFSGLLSPQVSWRAGVFRANSYNDILFVAAPSSSQSGYFKNFGETRRQGIELGMAAALNKLTISANYTYLDATYRTDDTLTGNSNSSNSAAISGNPGEEGTIQVSKGNRIPMIPSHLLKLSAYYQFTEALNIGANLVGVSSSYARGNENNAHQPDGVYYLSSGKSAGYGVLNLSAQYKIQPKLKLFGQLNNVFDREYSTAAQLGPNGFTAGGNFVARPFGPANNDATVQSTFYAPGTPRTLWVGIRYEFDDLLSGKK